MAAVLNAQGQQPAAAAAPAAGRSSSSISLEVWRAVSFIFEFVSKVGAGLIFTAVLTTHIPPWSVLVSLVLLTAAKRANAARQKMHDFENPEELQKLRAQAPYMSYSELRNSFHWSDLRRYNLIPLEGPNGLKRKVLLYLANPAYFESMSSSGTDIDELRGLFDERNLSQ